MPSPRETMFLQMVKDFPDSPMGHFSLGRLYLEERKFPEAAAALTTAVRLDPEYAAAMVALAEAHLGSGDDVSAKNAFQQAKAKALAQNHPSLAEEIDGRMEDL